MMWLAFGVVCVLLAEMGSPQGPLKHNKFARNLSVCLLILVLSYMTGMGGALSTDHEAYVAMLNHAESTTFSHFIETFDLKHLSFRLKEYNWEFGFIFFCFICKWIGLGTAGLFLLAALITNTFAIKTLYRFKYPVFCILIFITSRAYLQEANIVRQTMAISIFAYALQYLESRNFKKYALFVLLASTIHTSTIMTLFLYLSVYIKKEKQKTICYALVFFWIVSLLLAHSGGFINLSFLNGTIYYSLLEESEMLAFSEKIIDYRYNLFVGLLLFFYLYYQRGHKSNLNPIQFDIYLICTVIGVICCNFSVNVFYFYRVSLIFDIIYCFYLGSALQKMRIGGEKSKYSILFVAVFAFKVIAYINFCFNNNEFIGSSFYSIQDIFK